MKTIMSGGNEGKQTTQGRLSMIIVYLTLKQRDYLRIMMK